MNKTEQKRGLTDIENKPVVTSGEKEGERGNIKGRGKKRVIMGLYKIICVKLLKFLKHYRI